MYTAKWNTLGTFHRSKNNCSTFSVANWPAFHGRTTLRGIPRFWKNLYREFPSHLIFTPKFPEFFNWMVGISEIWQFPDFLKTFPGIFSTIFPMLRKLSSFCHVEIKNARCPIQRDWIKWCCDFVIRDSRVQIFHPVTTLIWFLDSFAPVGFLDKFSFLLIVFVPVFLVSQISTTVLNTITSKLIYSIFLNFIS